MIKIYSIYLRGEDFMQNQILILRHLFQNYSNRTMDLYILYIIYSIFYFKYTFRNLKYHGSI